MPNTSEHHEGVRSNRFDGHMANGFVFMFFGAWYIGNIWFRYLYSQRTKTRYINRLTFPTYYLPGVLGRIHCEAVIKLLVLPIGLYLEFIRGFDPHLGNVFYWGNLHHASIMLSFGISALTDVITYHRAWFLPKGTDYIAFALALTVEWVIYCFHGVGEHGIYKVVHVMVNMAAFGGIFATLAEMLLRKNVHAALLRASLLFLQGSWRWQIAFILFSPNRQYKAWIDNNDSIRICTLLFAIHCLAIYLGNLAVGFFLGEIIKGRYKNEYSYAELKREQFHDREVCMDDVSDDQETKTAHFANTEVPLLPSYEQP